MNISRLLAATMIAGQPSPKNGSHSGSKSTSGAASGDDRTTAETASAGARAQPRA